MNWLRESCLEGLSAILADEQGLGKTASVVGFLEALRTEFKSGSPVLIVVPPASLAFWEGELRFWGEPGLNVVSYAGSALARSVIHDHEIWLAAGSMDGRSTLNIQNGLPAKVSLLTASASPNQHRLTLWNFCKLWQTEPP